MKLPKQGTGAWRLKPRTAAALSIGCSMILATLHLGGVFEIPDLKLTDLRLRIRGQRPATDSIAVVEIDDRTVKAYQNRWPLPRDQYAALLAALNEGGAAAAGIDLLFLSEDPSDADGDSKLAILSEGRVGNVVHSALFVEEPSLQGGAALPPGVDRVLSRHGVGVDRIAAASAGIVTLPYSELCDSAQSIAHNSIVVDRDGVVRRLPLLLRYGERLYPSLSIRLLAAARGDGSIPRMQAARNGFRVQWIPGQPEQFLPMETSGVSAIDFAGDRDAFANRVAMIDVVRWYQAGDTTRLRHAFQGRIVLIGSTAVAQAAADLCSTPFSEATPGVYVHANALNALMNGGFLQSVPQGVVLALLAAMSLLLGLIIARVPVTWAAGLTSGAVLLVGILDYALFAIWRLDVPAAMALLLPPFTYVTVEGFAFFSLERQARFRERELQVARGIQARLLPITIPSVADLDVFGINIPAQEVGGDYYDWIRLADGTLAVILGDVSGKGVSAALLMSHLRASVHAEVREGSKPAAVAQAVHGSLFRATEANRFATCFFAFIPPGADAVLYCGAGHPALMVRGHDAKTLEATGLPLGLIEDTEYRQESEPLQRGDCLVVYSDGITECPWKDGMYGEERLTRVAWELVARGLRAEEIGTAILADLKAYCHGQLGADDVTLVIVRRT